MKLVIIFLMLDCNSKYAILYVSLIFNTVKLALLDCVSLVRLRIGYDCD